MNTSKRCYRSSVTEPYNGDYNESIFFLAILSSLGYIITEWLSDYYALLKSTTIKHPERLVTLDKDKYKDNENNRIINPFGSLFAFELIWFGRSVPEVQCQYLFNLCKAVVCLPYHIGYSTYFQFPLLSSSFQPQWLRISDCVEKTRS